MQSRVICHTRLQGSHVTIRKSVNAATCLLTSSLGLSANVGLANRLSCGSLSILAYCVITATRDQSVKHC